MEHRISRVRPRSASLAHATGLITQSNFLNLKLDNIAVA